MFGAVAGNPFQSCTKRITSGVSVGAVCYLIAVGLVAATIIAIFFGAGFLTLTPQAGETDPSLRTQSSSLKVGHPSDALLPPSTSERRPVGSFAESFAAADANAIDKTLSQQERADALGPRATQEVPSPSAVPRRTPDTLVTHLTPTKPAPSAPEITELLTRGDSLMRAGAVASARQFYERAAGGGDGRAALRLGATFDPVFLDRAGLDKVQADAAIARWWYKRALDLGAADTQPAVY